MTEDLSDATQAILLLTAPLIIGRERGGPQPLTPAQYRCAAQTLHASGATPADLLGPAAVALCDLLASACAPKLDAPRLHALLGRGFQLAQALEQWRSRALWVVSRADPDYPRRLRDRLRAEAPPVLYGCGQRGLLETGGLAVVGSRHVDAGLAEATAAVGALAAHAGKTLISGAARGIDQAAMNGALAAGGRAVGVLAADLKRVAVQREHRDLIQDERLVLLSPYDPTAGFNVGNAMQRNKLIYALADAALVMSADHNKGGTWAGAIEQLGKYRLVPLYVRTCGAPSPGLAALREAGAWPWPEPTDADTLTGLLAARGPGLRVSGLDTQAPGRAPAAGKVAEDVVDGSMISDPGNADLQGDIDRLFPDASRALTEAEIVTATSAGRGVVRQWLCRQVDQGRLVKSGRPARYRRPTGGPSQGDLFG